MIPYLTTSICPLFLSTNGRFKSTKAKLLKMYVSVLNLLGDSTQQSDFTLNSRIGDMSYDCTNQPVINYVKDLMVLVTLFTDEENLSSVF
ncbi:hypothetical protein D3C78_828150 [compost metagenome]